MNPQEQNLEKKIQDLENKISMMETNNFQLTFPIEEQSKKIIRDIIF